jgi:hypothetical protein
MTFIMLWQQSSMKKKGDLLLNSRADPDSYNAIAASLHGKKGRSIVVPLSKHYSYDAVGATLHRKEGRAMFELLVQARHI